MSSTGKSNSEKPQRVEGDSFPGPIKPIGDPHLKQAKGEASFSSGLTKSKADSFPGPIKPIGDPHSKQAKGEASVSSGLKKLKADSFPGPIKPIGTPDSKNHNGKNPYRFLIKLCSPFDYQKKKKSEALSFKTMNEQNNFFFIIDNFYTTENRKAYKLWYGV